MLLQNPSLEVKKYNERKYQAVEQYREEISPAVERGLVAAIYTQLSDVEDELNGLVTYDREVVKVDAAAMRELNLGMRKL